MRTTAMAPASGYGGRGEGGSCTGGGSSGSRERSGTSCVTPWGWMKGSQEWRWKGNGRRGEPNKEERKRARRFLQAGTKPAVPYFDTIRDSVAEGNEILPLRHLLGRAHSSPPPRPRSPPSISPGVSLSALFRFRSLVSIPTPLRRPPPPGRKTPPPPPRSRSLSSNFLSYRFHRE